MFWSVVSQESKFASDSWFGVETREIWLFEAKLHRGYAVTGLHMGPILFAYLGSSFGPLVGLESCWIVAAIQEVLLASLDAKYWCQVEDNWLWFTIGKLWKIALGHGISFWIFPFWCILLHCMWWESFFMHIIILHVMRSAFKVTNFGFSYGQ